jgi:putative peptide zinc metalloprotease protein
MSDLPEKPRVRQDLVFARRDEGGREVTVVKDPVTGRYFSVEEEEYGVMQLMDGTRTLDAVLAALDPETGIDREELRGFARLLDENNFLESNRPVPAKARRIEELSLFRIRIRVIDPRGAVDFLARRLGFLVSLPVLFLAGAVVLSAASLSLLHPGVLQGGMKSLSGFSSLAAFYIIVSVMMTIHEFAHAVVCRRFGGEVREMGFMLLYFIPCFYTDVSDIHLMGKKSRRVAVIAAGPLVELALWGLFTLGYFYFPGGTALSRILYIGMLSSGLKNVLVNFNPMIRVDGYYLLEEILGVDHLMEKSNRALFSALRALFGGGTGGAGEAGSSSSAGRAVLWVYGILSLAYIAALLFASALAAARYLHPHLGPWSYALVAVLGVSMLAGWLRSRGSEKKRKKQGEIT